MLALYIYEDGYPPNYFIEPLVFFFDRIILGLTGEINYKSNLEMMIIRVTILFRWVEKKLELDPNL